MAAANSLFTLTSSSIPFSKSKPTTQNPSSSTSSSLCFSLFSISSFENPCIGALNSHIQSSKLKPISHRYRKLVCQSSSSVQTTEKKEEMVFDPQGPKWSWRAIQAFALAESEARKFRFENTGTEHLLGGIIVEGTSLASRFLRGHGLSLTKVREESIKLLGDRIKGRIIGRPPITDEARKALDWAVNEKLKAGGGGEITTSDLLLGIWYSGDSLGYKVMVNLGFDDEKAEKLMSLSSEPGFDEG